MIESVKPRVSWALDAPSLDRLLAILDENREKAAKRFERLRARLTQFFTYETCPDPGHLADTVLDRLAHRAAMGEEILSVEAWAYGAARNVLQESRRSERLIAAAARELPFNTHSSSSVEQDFACLEECLRAMTPANRSLLERYYGRREKHHDEQTLIRARKRLAEELGISLEALRNRALRLRKCAESFMVECRRRKQSA